MYFDLSSAYLLNDTKFITKYWALTMFQNKYFFAIDRLQLFLFTNQQRQNF